MNQLRQTLHQQISQALGCTTETEYTRKKAAVLGYLRRTQPEQFTLEGGRRRAFEHMAQLEGITVDEKMEDFALMGYLLGRSFKRIPKAEALAALSAPGILERETAVGEDS
jgi:hypothetical protein